MARRRTTAPVTAEPMSEDEKIRRAAQVMGLNALMDAVNTIGRPTADDVVTCQRLVSRNWGASIGPVSESSIDDARRTARGHIRFREEADELLKLLEAWRAADGTDTWRQALDFMVAYREVMRATIYSPYSDAAQHVAKWLIAELELSFEEGRGQLVELAQARFAEAASGMATDTELLDVITDMWTSKQFKALEVTFMWPRNYYACLLARKAKLGLEDLIWLPWGANNTRFNRRVLNQWVAYAWRRSDELWAQIIFAFLRDGKEESVQQTLGDAYWPLMRMVAPKEPPYTDDVA